MIDALHDFDKAIDPRDILKFWHAVELFVPFNLSDVMARPSARFRLSEAQLQKMGNVVLPWLSEPALNKAGGDSVCEYKYFLYLLPFNKNELVKAAEKVFPLSQTHSDFDHFVEEYDDEGVTCFAKLSLDNAGRAELDKMAVSTLPWALGKLLAKEWNAFSDHTYVTEKLKLQTALNLLAKQLGSATSSTLPDFAAQNVMTACATLQLIDLLKKWACFSPSYPFSIVVELFELPSKYNRVAIQSGCGLFDDDNTDYPSIEKKESVDDFIVTNEDNPDQDLEILNSFFAHDLERVTHNLGGQSHALLETYVKGIHTDNRIDLYQKENAHHILEMLKPSCINFGRWPRVSSHMMSLMQQFAINQCFNTSSQQPLFSVNGPPGTGKTTLMQDILSENMVLRATALCEFKSASDVFVGKLEIGFSNKEKKVIRVLDKSVLGFEMLVVSSNNAAVENLSKALPLKRTIAAPYRETCAYLSPVAAKLLATESNGQVKPLLEEERPWGLISVALGNAKNKNDFCQKFFFAPEGSGRANLRIQQGEYLSIWEWKNHYVGMGFLDAKAQFLKKMANLSEHIDKIIALAASHEAIAHFQFDESYYEKKAVYEALKTELPDIILPPALEDIESETAQLQAFWQSPTLNHLRSDLFCSAMQLHQAWLAEVLKSGIFTQNVFAISYLLSNKKTIDPKHELFLWQSLFMIIPVISSTFSSIGRQFKNLEANALGWVLIDEAGQATPQSAVGALWRAKKALSVGDPLQIEPIFNVPHRLVEKLAAHFLKQGNEKWLPSLRSVQHLADEGTDKGAYSHVNESKQWIGCPLRIHRRCIEPMFSVANHIAYDNKMINARGQSNLQQHYSIGESCWFNVSGKTSDKQYVEQQGLWVLQLLKKLYVLEKSLPSVYIIAPFRSVKTNLQSLLSSPESCDFYLGKHHLRDRAAMRKWCLSNIGTIHAFQGKEAVMVILVLGADTESLGSVRWAVSKANLLNVALTRAKDRIYVVGDHALWSDQPYFCKLAETLPLVSVC